MSPLWLDIRPRHKQKRQRCLADALVQGKSGSTPLAQPDQHATEKSNRCKGPYMKEWEQTGLCCCGCGIQPPEEACEADKPQDSDSLVDVYCDPRIHKDSSVLKNDEDYLHRRCRSGTCKKGPLTVFLHFLATMGMILH